MHFAPSHRVFAAATVLLGAGCATALAPEPADEQASGAPDGSTRTGESERGAGGSASTPARAVDAGAAGAGGSRGAPAETDAVERKEASTTPPDAGRAPESPAAPLPPGQLIGWASVSALGVATTTGGGTTTAVTVTTLAELNTRARGGEPAVIQVSGTLGPGTLRIGSNKTVVGLAGAVLRGTLVLEDAVNVIVKNLKIVGYNCSDTNDCGEGGADAVVVRRGHHHWFDHLDISDGSDGNFDIRTGDYMTISWTKFHYSPQRDPRNTGDPHRFSNLITADDPVGMQRPRVTLHHCWWAENVVDRMPRVTMGYVHVFNSLYTSVNNSACQKMAGSGAHLRSENNAFYGSKTPIRVDLDTGEPGTMWSRGNLYQMTTGSIAPDVAAAGPIFTPPYPYTLEPASTVREVVMAGAGPR